MVRFASMLTLICRHGRDAFRQLRVDRLFSALVILSLTIGTAASAAIFSVVRGVVLKPLPYPEADALVMVQSYQPAVKRDQTSVSLADFTELRAAAKSFAKVAAFTNSEFVLSDGSQSERVIGASVDGEVFSTLGVRAMLGRVIEAPDAGQVPARVVVIANSLWKRRYASDPGLVGRSIIVDGEPHIVIGVAGAEFEFPRHAGMMRDIELFTPLRVSPMMMNRRGMRSLTVIARLAPEASLASAELEVAGIAGRLASGERVNNGWSMRAVELRDFMIGSVRPTLWLLFACVSVLLVIVAVNVSAATTARVVNRQSGFAIRRALGATERGIAALLFSESALLAAMAFLFALPLSVALRTAIMSVAPVAIPRQQAVGLDIETVAFTFALAALTTVLTILGPVASLRGLTARGLFDSGSRAVTGSRSMRHALNAFLTLQVAMGALLLGMTARVYTSYSAANRIDPGFTTDGVLRATVALPGMKYRERSRRTALNDALLERVSAVPGVEQAATASLLPLSGGKMSAAYRIVGLEADSNAIAAVRAVSAGFFQTLAIPVLEGRGFEPSDAETGELVAVVNKAFVRQSIRDVPALGSVIRVNAPGRDSAETFRIVGVVGDAKERGLSVPATPIIYFSSRQSSFPHMVLLVRSRAAGVAIPIRAALREIDPALALDDIGSLRETVEATFSLQTFLLAVLAIFASSAVVLIGVGIYGAVSYVTTAGLRGFAVRMALGASPSTIRWTILQGTMGVCLAGAAIGSVLLVAVMRYTSFLPSGSAPVGIADVSAGASLLILAFIAAAFPAPASELL